MTSTRETTTTNAKRSRPTSREGSRKLSDYRRPAIGSMNGNFNFVKTNLNLGTMEKRVLLQIFQCLTPTQWCLLSVVCTEWRSYLSEDSVWHSIVFLKWPEERKKVKRNFKEFYKCKILGLAIQPELISVPPVPLSSTTTNPNSNSAPTSERTKRKQTKIKHRNATDISGESHGNPSIGFGSANKSRTKKKRLSEKDQKLISVDFKPMAESVALWAKEQLRHYDVKIYDLSSLSSGDVLLALMHKLNPKLIDFERFDVSNPLRAVSNLFMLAEKHYGIPNLLRPTEFLEFSNPKEFLLYFIIFKEKTRDILMKYNVPKREKSPMKFSRRDRDHRKYIPMDPVIKYHLGREIRHLQSIIKDCIFNINTMMEEFKEQAEQIQMSQYESKHELERMNMDQRAFLTSQVIEEAFGAISALEEKNALLFEQNYWLGKKIHVVEQCLKLEEMLHRKAEQQLELEQKIRVFTSLLSERNVQFKL